MEVFELGTQTLENPGEAKLLVTKDPLFEAFAIFWRKKEPTFWRFSFPASNTVTHLYYPELARQLFELALMKKEKLGIWLDTLYLSGGILVLIRPDHRPRTIAFWLVRKFIRYEEVLTSKQV